MREAWVYRQTETPTESEGEPPEDGEAGEPTNDELAHWLWLHTEGRRAYPASHPWYELAAARLRASEGEPVAWMVTIKDRFGDERDYVELWTARRKENAERQVGEARKFGDKAWLTPLYAHPPTGRAEERRKRQETARCNRCNVRVTFGGSHHCQVHDESRGLVRNPRDRRAPAQDQEGT